MVAVGAVVACALWPAGSATAAHRRHHRARYVRSRRLMARAPLYRAALLEEADSGQVLYESSADLEWPPASMAKMMLLMVAEDEIKAGYCSLGDPVRISERAATTGGSRLGLREGEVHPLGELIKAALIKSANDAAVAVAEKVAGSTEACVRMMNRRARSMGLTHTVYHTVDGLPPRPMHDVDVTDAYDLATVGRAMVKNSDLLRWAGEEEALFDGGEAVLHNTNHLVGSFEGCDGLKTGFTYHAGFNLTATAKRGDMRLIAVVLGAPSNNQRFRQAARLMEWGFDNFTKVTAVKRGEPLPVHVQVEAGPLIQPIAADDFCLVVPKNRIGDVRLEYDLPASVNGPLAAGAQVGEVIVREGQQVLAKVPAVRPAETTEAGLGVTTVAAGAPAASAGVASIAVAPSGGALGTTSVVAGRPPGSPGAAIGQHNQLQETR